MDNAKTIEEMAAQVVEGVAACRNGVEREVYCFWKLRRPDAAHMLIASDWAVEHGFLKVGTTNASAKTWSKFSAEMLYVTKAGRAFMHAQRDLAAVRFLAQLAAAKAARAGVSP
jgi:hypothetical protein